ncbi:MAG: tetratricopeptide repeat protein [Ignavibacteria bacterium]|nr:tetratricopeptide repeat protein [Ignavibacteria bacterium]
MTHEEMNELLSRAEAEISNGGNLQAEKLCNDVLAGLLEVPDDSGSSHLVFRSRALRLLSESLARRRRGTDALPLGETALTTAKEAKSDPEEAKAIANLGFIYHILADYDRALEFCNTALTMFRHQSDAMSEARILIIFGHVYTSLGTYNIALEYTTKALTIYEALNDKQGITHATGNIGIVYGQLYDNERALEYYNRALDGHHELGNRAGVAGMLCNIGNTFVASLDYPQALEFYGQALAILEEIDLQGFIANVLNNIAAVHFRMSNYGTLLEQYKRVLAIREKIGDKLGAADQMTNIGELYGQRSFDGYDPIKAEEYLLKGLAMTEETGAKHSLCDTIKMVANFYKSEKRWQEFAFYFEKYHDLEKEVLNEETQKAVELTEHRRQIAEREKSLAVERARAQATEVLLHKTLPPSIADRVIQGELRIADHFESASILFADVVGFTKISAQMPPAAVLGFMNFVFEEFDAIAAKHGCERIKTIGDGYMAVCGAPVKHLDHSERLARMALAMMEDIRLPEDIRKYLPEGTRFQLRIGLHCGEITAGLICSGKLAYDIYGDAVNTASRMESHGEAGKIHVSDEFKHSVETLHATSLQFIRRGEMEIKGKGMMKTYF